ncbi:MAG: hypothetical protein WCJ57_03520 [Candidatus Falkowbacteria bacterium]
MDATNDKVKISSYGNGGITIIGLSPESLDRLMASISSGAYYIRCHEGKLISVPIWKELPEPTDDEKMLPFWRKATNEETAQTILFDEFIFENQQVSSPAITIQSLCGYNYSPENYKFYAEKLKSYGFECLRSRRGNDAKFWELWSLPALCFAKGDLADHIKMSQNDTEKLNFALNFLKNKIAFGSLNVSTQRLAQIIE